MEENSKLYHLQVLKELIEQSKFFLIISFEDSNLFNELKDVLASKNYDSLSKIELNGKSINEILKLIRRNKYDAVIISNRFSIVNRSHLSLMLLGSLVKAKKIFILYDENKFALYGRLNLIIKIFPIITCGFLYGIYNYLKAVIYFNFFSFTHKPRGINKRKKESYIAYLRTDLAGHLKAGGSVSHILGFISGAEKLGFQVVYFSDFPLAELPITIIIKPDDLLDIFDEFKLIHYNFILVKRLKKIFKENSPSVIYQRHSIFNLSGVILGLIFNVPVILEVNHSEVWVKKNWSRLVFEKLATKIENLAFRYSDLICVVSDATKDYLIKLGVEDKKIIVNPNGVDPEKFSPKIKGLHIRDELNLGGYFVVGFIGTFTRWHGVETLFDAAVKVLSKSNQIKFLLIGDGNLKTALELKTHQLGLEEKIIFTGIVPHEKVPEYLAACDVLVSPHLGFESGERFFGSPTKLFEYMAMGKPIIASDLEQIGEIIKHDVNGLKFNPGNSKQLAEMILYLYNNQDLGIRLGAKAREDVIKNYTWEHNARRVLEKVFEL